MITHLVLALAATGAPTVNLGHLDWLRRDVATPEGGTTATWQIYASPVKKGDRRGPYRFVGDEDEGVGCVDDVARAAIVYAREHARTGSLHAGRQARAGYDFLARMARPDGTYVNFIWGDGSLHLEGPTSSPGLNWWTARALWALAEGARAFTASDPAYARLLRDRAFVTVKALEADLNRRDGTWRYYGTHKAPGWFIGEAPDVTAVAVLGLATLHQDGEDATLKRLIGRYGEAIALWAPNAVAGGLLDGAHLPGLGPTTWHAYGAHMLHALALGGRAIGSKRLVAAAREEADRFAPKLLALGGPIAGVLPGYAIYPQIAYGVEPMALGLLALEEATGEARYGRLGALFASWLYGANPTRTPMYDAATGRVWDGIDHKGVSADSGAESTIEALLTLQAFVGRPALWSYLHARETGGRAATFLEAEKATGARAVGAGEMSGDRAARMSPGATLRLASGDLRGRYRLLAVARREGYVAGERATLTIGVGPQRFGQPLAWPPQGAPWAAGEAIGPRSLVTLGPRVPLTVSYEKGARQDVWLDGVMAVPELTYRRFTTDRGPVTAVYNASGATRRLTTGRSAVSLPPGGALVIEGPAALE
jgi:hypothetical protein